MGAYGKIFTAFDEDRGALIAMKTVELGSLRKKSEDVKKNFFENKYKKIKKLIY